MNTLNKTNTTSKTLIAALVLAIGSACSLDKSLIELDVDESAIIAGAVVNAGLKPNTGFFASMSEATGVAKNNNTNVTGIGQNVRTVYLNNKSVLPENIIDSIKQGSATMNLAYMKVASSFCDVSSNTASIRAVLFPGVNFGVGNQLSSAGQINASMDALFDRFIKRPPTSEDYAAGLELMNTIAVGQTQDDGNLTRSKALHLCTFVSSLFENFVL
jgi:hypothetical protein